MHVPTRIPYTRTHIIYALRLVVGIEPPKSPEQENMVNVNSAKYI